MIPNFSDPQKVILTSTQKYNLFMAGIASGKTFLMGIITGYLVNKFPHIHGFLGANTYQQLTTSTLKRCRQVWKEYYNWDHGVDYVVGIIPPKTFDTTLHQFDDYSSIISFKNGSILYKGSMDNAYVHDGKEFAFAALDEVKDTKRDAVLDVINTRIRMPFMYVDSEGQLSDDPTGTPFNPFYFFTSPAAVEWMNEFFELNERQNTIQSSIFNDGNYYHSEYNNMCICISSTHHNEHNLPQGFIEDQVAKNPSKSNSLIYGDPFKKAENVLYSSFDRYTTVGKGDGFEYKEGSVVHLSFDQNRVPYNTSLLSTVNYVGDVIEVTFFDEFCPGPPNNQPEHMINGLIKGHHYKMINETFIYGDPQGQRKTAYSGNDTHYKLILKGLKRYINNSSFRVQKKHPPVGLSVDFVNNCFSGVYPKIRIKINERCKHLINDLQFLRQNKNGGKKIELDKDGFEKYGHTSDAMRYQLITLFWSEFKKQFLS